MGAELEGFDEQLIWQGSDSIQLKYCVIGLYWKMSMVIVSNLTLSKAAVASEASSPGTISGMYCDGYCDSSWTHGHTGSKILVFELRPQLTPVASAIDSGAVCEPAWKQKLLHHHF